VEGLWQSCLLAYSAADLAAADSLAVALFEIIGYLTTAGHQ